MDDAFDQSVALPVIIDELVDYPPRVLILDKLISDVETNGTIAAPPELDWVCVSPKAGAELVQKQGDELKLVYPQAEPEAQPEQLESLDFTHFFLQPMDSERAEENTRLTINYCLGHPQWKLSLQTHKLLGLK